MSLNSCCECKKPISMDARRCPVCGTKTPAITNEREFLTCVIVLIIILAPIFSAFAAQQQTAEPQSDKSSDNVSADKVLAPPPLMRSEVPLTSQALAACTQQAANLYRVPVAVLIGIMNVEKGEMGKETRDTSGDYAVGPMQISSHIFPQLAQLWNVDIDTAHKWIRDDGCENVYVAAWLLRKKIDDTGSLQAGIAAFHPKAGAPDLSYADKVIKVMDEKKLINHDSPLQVTGAALNPNPPPPACQIRIGAIVCEEDPQSDVALHNAATVYEMYGFNADVINQSYTQAFLKAHWCVVIKQPHDIKAMGHGRVATPNGWVNLSRVLINGMGMAVLASDYLLGACDKYVPNDKQK